MSEAERTEPDAILFDLGGVLMDFGGLRRLAELSGQSEDPSLRSRWVASKWVQAFERGTCDAAAFAEGVVADWGLLFLDDSSEHVQAARALGMRAEQTRGLREVRDALQWHLPARSPAGRAVRSVSQLSTTQGMR